VLEITREIRLSLVRPMEATHPPVGANTWAGWPASMTVAPFVIVRSTFRGAVDSETGYLVDIRRIDEALRRVVLSGESIADLAGDSAIKRIWHGLLESWTGPPDPAGVELEVSPYLRFGVTIERTDMVRITQCYEFSASHRLACSGNSEEENQAVFGKCSNPNGHGHNYMLEVTVSKPSDAGSRPGFTLPALEAVVHSQVLQRFDHKHLNEDCEEFAELNPSVENIARVIWGLLVNRISGAELANVRVWETAKTRADYCE